MVSKFLKQLREKILRKTFGGYSLDLSIIGLLIIPLTIDIATIHLTFLSWYERELKYKTILTTAFIMSVALCTAFWFLSIWMPEELTLTYQVISTTLFFLMFPQLYLLTIWARKGAQKAFLLLAVSAYISAFWLLLPLGYALIPNLDIKGKVLASYISGAILGTLFPIGIIEEVRPRDGFITASAATTALSISDAASKYIYNFTIFMDIKIQLAIIAGSALLSFILYKRAAE